MGLLDDAIRDHLELKRLRGADPGEVAREQREALEPELLAEPDAGEEEQATAVEDLSFQDDRETLPVQATPAVTPTSSVDPFRAASPADSTDSSNLTGETAELDMRSVLGADEGTATGAESADSAHQFGPVADRPRPEEFNEDQPAREVPGDSPRAQLPHRGQSERRPDADGR